MRFLIILIGLVLPTAGTASAEDKPANKPGSDPSQSFISPLGLGTGATLTVGQDATGLAASLFHQFDARFANYFQVGLSGTLNKDGQALIYSTRDADAPGFKGKFGVGHSSFQTVDTTSYTAAGGQFAVESWCLETVGAINATLPKPQPLGPDSRCKSAVAIVSASLKKNPPLDAQGQPDLKAIGAATNVLAKLAALPTVPPGQPIKLLLAEQQSICKSFQASAPELFNLCPQGGNPIPSVGDRKARYPDAYDAIVKGYELGSLYYMIALNWIPNYTSVAYRSVTDDIPDLETKRYWNRLLHTVALDGAVYYRRYAVGFEAAYGEAVDIKQQNICDTTVNGTFSAESCQLAMVGEPDPKSTWSGTLSLSVDPLTSSSTTLFRPAVQLLAYYERATSGGAHKTQISLPFYLVPISTPVKFVVGVQPQWTSDSDPLVGDNLAVSLFIGARPSTMRTPK